MEFTIILVVFTLLYIFLKIVFSVKIKQLKQFEKDEYLDEIVSKYPENKVICKEILEKVKGIIVEQLGVADTAVTMEASFIDDLGADSLDIVELVMAIEEEFDIEIPDSDAEKVVTVGDVVDYIKENV